MKIVNLVQGTKEWKQHRFQHFNASEAAAMLGLDPKTSRSELLRMKATGSEKEFSDFVQRQILDKGHEVEAMARPIVEEMIGEELYPVTAVDDDGIKSASYDGLTMMEDIIFEHKQWNQQLAEMVDGGVVPDTHMPQLQQQLMISGSKKVIFVVSDGTPEKMVHCEVLPSEEWFERINLGWKQFALDLQEYEHKTFPVQPTAEVIRELPALFVNLSGEVKSTNLPAVKDAAISFVKSINTDLKTDEDFVNADAAVKFCADAEKKLEAAKESALAQTSSIDELMKTIDYIKEEMRQKRLDLEKLIKARKQEIRDEIALNAKKKFAEHLAKANAGIAPCMLPAIHADFAGAMKGKKNLESLHNAVDTELANAKIEADRVAALIRENLNHYGDVAKGYEFLFSDLNNIVRNPLEAFSAIVESRISQHKHQEEAKIQAERERIRQEEQKAADNAVAQHQVEQKVTQKQEVDNSRTSIFKAPDVFESWWHKAERKLVIGENESFDSFAKRVAESAFYAGMKSVSRNAA